MANRAYGLTIEEPNGTIAAYLQSASNATLTFTLNGVSSLQVTFDAASADAAAIYSTLQSTLPVARLARDGTTVFLGPMESLDISIADSGEVSATFTDWAGLFGHWRPYGKYKNTASNTIITALLGLARWPQSIQQLTKSGSVTATASVNNTEQSSVLEQIAQAGAVAPFDWYVDHAAGTFKIANQHGTNKSASVRLDVGQINGTSFYANGQSARVTLQPPRNRIWSNTGKGKLVESYSTPSSLKTDSLANYGEYFERVECGKANAQSFANAYARYSFQQVVELTVDPQLAPAWGTDYYLGDTVSVLVASNAFAFQADQRVNQIVVSFDDQLVEVSNTLTFEVV